ncbi:large tegument protein [Leporid alphaherpesvirus 4]|uniref:Large tegument protein n=1 Tax=Leporid alphaherpesvirus 4 TaxID=481315 RepID=J9R071_9ALPH|nr:large tegument protein [Leporid alphaherpesvirus 4]AFR32477.1 large tegument protein [Leporid alphaherpesvirus 4]
MRASLSFLSLVYDVGIHSALSADAIDGCLLEGRAWTAAPVVGERTDAPPRMCSAIELPNRIDYSPMRGVCCVFSRVYGDVRFFEGPTKDLMDTQCPAHEFFAGPWALHATSYSVITIGAVGLGVFRSGDDVYVFDPHGLPDGSPAFIARTRAGDLYTYLTYYTHGRADVMWAGTMVFFVPAGPDSVDAAALAAAVLQLYGVGETYLTEEPFVERRVASTHPWRSDGALMGAAIVGRPADPPEVPQTTAGRATQSWAPALKEIDRPESIQPAPQAMVVDDGDFEVLASPPTNARVPGTFKRRRPTLVPSPSIENLSPSRRFRHADSVPKQPSPRGTWAKALKAHSGSRQAHDQAQHSVDALFARQIPRPPEEDLAPLRTPRPETEAAMARMLTRQANIAHEADVCESITVNALRSQHHPALGLLEHAIVFLFDRILAFLVENGARTHPGAVGAGPAQVLLDQVVRLMPQPATTGDFLASTGLALSEVAAHLPLIQPVLEENSSVGKLALAKLVLVARDVTRATDAFHGELAEFEQELRNAPAPEMYAKLSEWLMRRSQDIAGELFAPATPTHPEPLMQRVQNLATFARTEEARADAEGRALRAAVAALARVVAAAAERGSGSLAYTDDLGPPPDVPRKAPNRPIQADIESVHADARRALRAAVREYFRKGAVYSAGAMAAGAQVGGRFNILPEASAPVRSLVRSLSSFDAQMAEVARRAGVPAPPPVAHGETATILRELLRDEGDLDNPEALSRWMVLLSDAAGQGLIDAKELADFRKAVEGINDRASKRDSGLAELARFRDIDARIRMALENEAAFGAGREGSQEIGQLIESALRHAKTLESGKASGNLSAEELADVGARARELESVRDASREASERANREREALFRKLGKILQPIQGFAGLRAAPAVLQALSESLPPEYSRVAEAAAAAPPETTTALRADLWALLEQYREALERPTANTATMLSGIPQSFTAVIDTVFSRLPEAPALRRFFLAHAQRIAEALSAAVAAGMATSASADPLAAASLARVACGVLEEALADLGPAAGPGSPLNFMVGLTNDARGYANSAELAARARASAQRMTDAGSAAAELVGKLRRAEPDAGALLPEAARAKEALDLARLEAEREFGGLLRAEVPSGDLSPSGRALHELGKAVTAARRRAEELDAAASDLQKKIAEHSSQSARDQWEADVSAALDRVEAAAEFDVVELRRLQVVAKRNSYNTREFRKRADQALASASRTAVAALEAALAFNPYTPENQRHEVLPPLAAARGILWAGAFHATADTYADMFGVDPETVARPLRVLNGMLDLAHAGGGFIDYHEVVMRCEEDLSAIPSLRRYVNFFRRGHAEYLSLRDRLDEIRADVNRAKGSVPLELERASKAALLAKDDAAAAADMMRAGVSLDCPGELALDDAIAELGRVDQAPFSDSAYAEYVAYVVKRDLGDAKEALVRAKRQRADATEAVSAALREAIAARDRRVAAEASDLANLKTMLHILAPPPAAGKTLDQAKSAQEIADQIVVLIDSAEQAAGPDAGVSDWLSHALSVLETHPLTKAEDGRPMILERHAARVSAIAEKRRGVEDLRASLERAEAEWDDAWAKFARSRGRVLKSAQDLAAVNDLARALQHTTNTVQGLRATQHYAGISPRYRGALEGKITERAAALSETGDVAARHKTTTDRLRDEVLKSVPWELDAQRLRALRATFDDIAKDLPEWALAEFRGARELIQHRLGLYTAYAAEGSLSGPAPLLLAGQAPARSPPDERSLRLRGAAYSTIHASGGTLVLDEASSALDGPFPTCYLTPDGNPLQYAMCYPRATDKLGAMIMSPDADCMRPALPAENLESPSTIAAMHVLTTISGLQLALADARAAGFEAFGKFVRHRQAKWPSAIAAAAETYASLIASTLTRETGARWDELGLAAGAVDPHPLADPPAATPRAQLTPEDVLVLLVAGCPEHIYNFWRLDLVRQHEYMQLTLPRALETSIRAALFVRGLGDRAGGLPVPAGPSAPTRGLLFGTRIDDWRRGTLSGEDPLAAWRDEGLLAGAASDFAALTPGQARTAVSVLGRMCVPSVALGAMWTCLRPDYLGSYDSFDALLAARLGGATVRLTATEQLLAPAEPGALYPLSGRRVTIVSRPDADSLERVTAMDLVLCATLLGAPLVVAMVAGAAFSARSGLKLCLVLFDSRDGCPDSDTRDALSTDVSAWASDLLAADPHAIENACLAAQLPGLSAMLAARPLSRAAPCLVLVDISMTPTHVLWGRDADVAAPEVQFVGGDAVDALPFVQSAPADEDLAPLATASDPFMSEAILGQRFDEGLLSGNLFPGAPVYSRHREHRFAFASRPDVSLSPRPRAAGERRPARDVADAPAGSAPVAAERSLPDNTPRAVSHIVHAGGPLVPEATAADSSGRSGPPEKSAGALGAPTTPRAPRGSENTAQTPGQTGGTRPPVEPSRRAPPRRPTPTTTPAAPPRRRLPKLQLANKQTPDPSPPTAGGPAPAGPPASPLPFPPVSSLPPLPEDSSSDEDRALPGVQPGSAPRARRSAPEVRLPRGGVRRRAAPKLAPAARPAPDPDPTTDEEPGPLSPSESGDVSPPEQDSPPPASAPGIKPGAAVGRRRAARSAPEGRPRPLRPALSSWTSITSLNTPVAAGGSSAASDAEDAEDFESAEDSDIDDNYSESAETPYDDAASATDDPALEPDVEPRAAESTVPTSISNNSLISRVYVKSSGRGAIALLVEACRRIQSQLQHVKRALVLQSEGVLAGLHHIRMLLGQAR